VDRDGAMGAIICTEGSSAEITADGELAGGSGALGSGRLVIQRSSRKTLSTVSLLPHTIVTNTINPTVRGIAASAIARTSVTSGCITLSAIWAPITARPVPSLTQPEVLGRGDGAADPAGPGARSHIAVPDWETTASGNRAESPADRSRGER